MYSFFIPALAVISFSVLTSWFINTEIVTALFDGRLLSYSSLHPLLHRQTIRHSQGNDKEKLYSNTRRPAACILSHSFVLSLVCWKFVCSYTTIDYNEFLLNFSGVSFHISVWLGLEIPSDRFHYIFYFTRTLKSDVSYIIIFSIFRITFIPAALLLFRLFFTTQAALWWGRRSLLVVLRVPSYFKSLCCCGTHVDNRTSLPI